MNDGRIDCASETSWASACLNCGAPLTGRFCSSCGQRAIPSRPTVRELAAIEGRRARYISPVRLYLICSVVYFLVAVAAPLPDEELSLDVGFTAGIGDSDPTGAAFDKAARLGLDAAAIYGVLWGTTGFGVSLLAARG